MQRNHRSWITTGLALCLLASCSTTPRGSQNQYEGREGGNMVAVEGNQALARKLAITNPIHKREGGRMVVQFELQNTQSSQVDFAWAVDWFDQAGFRIDDSTRRWEPAAIGGNGSKILQVIAPRPEATSWKLQITSRDEVK